MSFGTMRLPAYSIRHHWNARTTAHIVLPETQSTLRPTLIALTANPDQRDPNTATHLTTC